MDNFALTSNFMPMVSSFEAYKAYVKSIPAISEEEERTLVERLKSQHCLQSAQKLIMSQLRTVVQVAQQHKGYGLPEEDLVQEGNIGLMKAVKNFDLKHNVRLYTYALIWIKSEIQTFVLKNWKIVKIATTKNLKKLFFNFKTVQKELMDFGVSKQELIANMSKRLDVSEEDAKEMQAYFANHDISIDYDNEEDNVFQLPDHRTPEQYFELKHDQEVMENKLGEQLNMLTERQRQVLQWRYFSEEKKTHKEIASILNVSSERVRQIEQDALQKLKKLLTS